MKTIMAIARRELRSAFSSLLAYIFLLIFLLAVVWDFFPQLWQTRVATCHALFQSMPLLLLILIPPLTMRLWAEERRQKTLELLLSYPIQPAHAVLGKFFASFALVLLALLLTLGIPLTVAQFGDLDIGPVVGGYVAAALVGAAYLSIGLFVSSLCNSQILAFLLTLIVCGLLWFIGEDSFLNIADDYLLRWFGEAYREVFTGLGIGARFRSVARGVLDLRDMVYYLGLICFFLFLNVRTLALRKWLS